MEVFLSESSLGYGSYISDYSKVYRTAIGKYTSIGQCVNTAIGNHPISSNISTSPSFFSMEPRNGLSLVKRQLFQEYLQKEGEHYSIYIGNDVWIGNNVTILPGIRIGDGAIIGAGSVVTKDVEAYTVCVGNPARKLRYRFEPEEIKRLLEIKWWDRDESWIRENAEVFSDPKRFLEIQTVD
ncbi:MAG: CatB-related O-acetyltransferase [Roseburia sp.]|nr:CatB-related O-acetyltransferase [Roseburia sp.]